MSLLDRLLDRSGITKSELPDMYSKSFRGSVERTQEFIRIENLPRKHWKKDSTHRAAIEIELDTAIGEMHLWPIQTQALAEIVLNKGGFFPIGVGQGKALISLLAPVLLCATRPILFVPAQLRDQTNKHVVPEMLKHWRLNSNLRVIGYSELSLAKNSTMLARINPDLIILDECHRVKNRRAGRTKRLVRWFKAKPHTQCVAMSGTISNRSILDYAHILDWCLGDNAPLPRKWNELSAWSDALDGTTLFPTAPGALYRFCAKDEPIRQGFQRRLTESHGVVATHGDVVGASLRIGKHPITAPKKIKTMIHQLRNTWETPNGDLLTEAVEVWRHIRELALGFWYRWKHPAPDDWMEARREWKRFARGVLSHNRRGLDTELQVTNAYSDSAEYTNWKKVKDNFTPETEPVWESGFAIDQCIEWLKKGGICWVEHAAFGQALAKKGVPYFGAGDNNILTTEHTAIATSIRAHSEGKNLQRFSRNLISSIPSSGKTWEQLMGRTHRNGQTSDEVTFDVFAHVPELRASFDQARADARYLEDTLGNRQKLNYADIALDLL